MVEGHCNGDHNAMRCVVDGVVLNIAATARWVIPDDNSSTITAFCTRVNSSFLRRLALNSVPKWRSGGILVKSYEWLNKVADREGVKSGVPKVCEQNRGTRARRDTPSTQPLPSITDIFATQCLKSVPLARSYR